MKDTWRFATPTFLAAGKGKADNLPQYLNSLVISKPMLVIDPEVARTQKGKQVIKTLKKKNREIFQHFSTNPTTYQVDEAVKLFRKYKPDGLITIGGGSAIDLSKAVLLVGLNGGKVVDYLNGKKGTKKFIPFIVLPTTCGTGSEGSPYAVISDPDTKKKRGIEDYNFLPDLVIIDPEFVPSLDKTVIAATTVDALAHVLESFISKKANELTKGAARGLLLTIKRSMEKAAYKKDITGIEEMMNIAFSSRLLYPRTGLTIAHALSHPLGAYTHIHHGAAVSFFLPESLRFNYPSCKKELTEASRLMGFLSFEEFLKWFADFAKKSGIQTTIRTHLAHQVLPVAEIAEDGMESSNIPSNPRSVTANDMKNVIMQSIKYWKVM